MCRNIEGVVLTSVVLTRLDCSSTRGKLYCRVLQKGSWICKLAFGVYFKGHAIAKITRGDSLYRYWPISAWYPSVFILNTLKVICKVKEMKPWVYSQALNE
jgi:hypothetical protein